MQLIYLHGLNGSSQGEKGQLLQQYCAQFYPDVRVLRPDLNLPPQQVLDLLDDLVTESTPTVVMGLSLFKAAFLP